MAKRELADLLLELHHETPLAILVSTDGDAENAVWIPKSACQYEKRRDGLYAVTMPEKLALDKGLT